MNKEFSLAFLMLAIQIRRHLFDDPISSIDSAFNRSLIFNFFFLKSQKNPNFILIGNSHQLPRNHFDGLIQTLITIRMIVS